MPNVRFQVAAAFSFSECAIVIVASKSRISCRPGNNRGPPPADHTLARAAARAARSWFRCSGSTRWTTRHAVESLATVPNSLP